MEKIIDSIESPFWWFSVVFVGIIITLVSSYLKLAIDRLIGFERSTAVEKQEDEGLIRSTELIRSAFSHFTLAKGHMLLALLSLVIAIFIGVLFLYLDIPKIQTILVGFIFAISFVFSLRSLFDARKVLKTVKIAVEQIKPVDSEEIKNEDSIK